MTPLTFAQRIAENRRICILRTLAESTAYRANDSLLHMVVDEFGFACSRDQVRTELSWLRDQGFVTLADVAGLYVATITQAGLDVAAGHTTVPGVKRPEPR